MPDPPNELAPRILLTLHSSLRKLLSLKALGSLPCCSIILYLYEYCSLPKELAPRNSSVSEFVLWQPSSWCLRPIISLFLVFSASSFIFWQWNWQEGPWTHISLDTRIHLKLVSVPPLAIRSVLVEANSCSVFRISEASSWIVSSPNRIDGADDWSAVTSTWQRTLQLPPQTHKELGARTVFKQLSRPPRWTKDSVCASCKSSSQITCNLFKSFKLSCNGALIFLCPEIGLVVSG